MTPISIDELRSRVAQLDAIPSIPAILVPLLRCLDEPPESIDLQRIIDLISHDKSLTAQTLHMANSPLFSRWQTIQTVRGAVLALGTTRVRDIATACCLLKLTPQGAGRIDPRSYWEHSLACALVARRFARKIGFPDPERAYVCGLLHDLGMIVNLLVIPDEFQNVTQMAARERIPMDVAERQVLGFTHGFTGDLLVEHWKLGRQLQEVMRRHHDVQNATESRSLVALINVSDLLCRMRGMGYGYLEGQVVDLSREIAWEVLSSDTPALQRMDWARFTFELDAYIREVSQLVSVLFRFQ